MLEYVKLSEIKVYIRFLQFSYKDTFKKKQQQNQMPHCKAVQNVHMEFMTPIALY